MQIMILRGRGRDDRPLIPSLILLVVVVRAIALSLQDAGVSDTTSRHADDIINVDDDGVDDGDVQFQAELSRALELSKAEANNSSSRREEGPPATIAKDETPAAGPSGSSNFLSERYAGSSQYLARPFANPRSGPSWKGNV
jgi:hypothetical protein